MVPDQITWQEKLKYLWQMADMSHYKFYVKILLLSDLISKIECLLFPLLLLHITMLTT